MTTTLDTPSPDAQSVRDGARTLTCIGRERITHDVVSFHFRPVDGLPFEYEAGQYITIMARLDGSDVSRCFTLSSSPSRPERLTITVKRKQAAPGQQNVSSWLHERVGAGDEIRVLGPLGDFTTGAHPGAKYLFVSAGSGITPLMSLTRWLRDTTGADIVFVHSAHTPADVIFGSELEALAAGGMRVHTVCTRGSAGRLTPQQLASLVPDLAEREVFVCGPEGFRQVVRAAASVAGADPARCRTESFDIGRPDAAKPSTDTPDTDRQSASYAVEFVRSGRTVDCAADTTVLAAALREGLVLPSSCTEGMCGTCKSTMVSGSVDMHHQGGIRPKEIAAGKILLCCSKPTDDLVIDA